LGTSIVTLFNIVVSLTSTAILLASFLKASLFHAKGAKLASEGSEGAKGIFAKQKLHLRKSAESAGDRTSLYSMQWCKVAVVGVPANN
jgi:hypothetical protein